MGAFGVARPQDASQNISHNPANRVMARVRAGFAYLSANDPGSDWDYFLDSAGEVRWNDAVVYGYSFGGQMGVAAQRVRRGQRIVITSAPHVPVDSP